MAEDLYRRRPLWVIETAAIVSGLLLGPLDLAAQRMLPYPWANLANSSAVWAIGAFGVGVWVRNGRWRPAIAGVTLLLVAVESYYLAAVLAQHDDASTLWASSTLSWLLFGVLAGVVFGAAGGWSRGDNRWLRVLAVAMPGAVLLAEAGVLVYRSGNGGAAYRSDSLRTAAIEAALAIGLPFVIGRTTRHRLMGLATSVPFALMGFGGFVLTGFGR